MSVRTKLMLNIVAALLAFSMIGLGVTSVLSEKRYVWNSDVNIESTISDLYLDMVGSINSAQIFDAKVEDGEINNPTWQISSRDTTFSTDRKTIVITLTFINRSTQSLRIDVDGIMIDPLQRFTTSARDANGVAMTIQQTPEENIGSLSVVLAAGNNETKEINLVYELVKTNLEIKNETQNISVLIGLNEEV